MRRSGVSCARKLLGDAAREEEEANLVWMYQYRHRLRERSLDSLEDGHQVSLLSNKLGERGSTQKTVG